MQSRAAITILDNLINKAVRINNNLFELKLKEQTYIARLRFNR
jgi:hypothetical protein